MDIFEMGDKRITLRVNAVLEVVEGRIAAWREYYEGLDLARQLGVDPNLVVEEQRARAAVLRSDATPACLGV